MEQLESRIRHLEAENEILRIHSLECITPNKNIMDVLKDLLDTKNKEMHDTAEKCIESSLRVGTELHDLQIENRALKVCFSDPPTDLIVKEFELRLQQHNEKRFQAAMKNIERLWFSADPDDELKSQVRFDAVVRQYWQWQANRGVKRKHACVEEDPCKTQV
jgi:hypothetical protein